MRPSHCRPCRPHLTLGHRPIECMLRLAASCFCRRPLAPAQLSVRRPFVYSRLHVFIFIIPLQVAPKRHTNGTYLGLGLETLQSPALAANVNRLCLSPQLHGPTALAMPAHGRPSTYRAQGLLPHCVPPCNASCMSAFHSVSSMQLVRHPGGSICVAAHHTRLPKRCLHLLQGGHPLLPCASLQIAQHVRLQCLSALRWHIHPCIPGSSAQE